MPRIATSLATSLGTRIATSLGGRDPAGGWTLPLSDLTVSSDGGYFLDPVTPQIIGGFGANQIPQGTIGGKQYAGIFASRTNLITYSQNLAHGDWVSPNCSASQQTDPLGGSTAWKIIQANGAAGDFYQSPTFDGSSKYVFAFVAKANEWTWINIYSNGAGNCNAWFDLAGVVTGTRAGFDSSDIYDVGNGWRLCVAVMTSSAAAAKLFDLRPTNADNTLSNGDGTSGVTVWNPGCEVGAYPICPIKTVAAAVTRAADVVYWASASVAAAMWDDVYTIPLVNFWAHTEPAGNLYVLAVDANNYLRWNNTAKTFELYTGGVKKMETNALTATRYSAAASITMNLGTGDATATGFATGNGANAGTATSWTPGNLYFGSDHAGANQFDGLLGEPYA